MSKTNLVLIGMPACGKSTLGVLVAKALNLAFLDTDLLLQQRQGKLLWELLEAEGTAAFLQIEAEVLLGLRCENTCISTGGSAVYSREAMLYLKQNALFVYPKLSYETIAGRLADIQSRGVVMEAGKTLLDIYREREPLYACYADITVPAEGKGVEETVFWILQAVTERNCL